MALADNTSTKIDQESEKASELMRKSVLARFFPQFSANGLYSYQSKRTYILPETANTSFGSIGLNGVKINAPWAQLIGTLMPDLASGINTAVGDMMRVEVKLIIHFAVDVSYRCIDTAG